MSPNELGVSFKRATLKGSTFEDSVLRSCDFGRTDFGSAEVVRTRFEDCEFDYFELSNSRLEEASFRGGHAMGGSILESRLSRCLWEHADWTGAVMQNNLFDACIFRSVNLARAGIENNFFHACRFEDCNLADQTFVYSVLMDCEFNGVEMDLEVLTTCSGLTLRGLKGVRVSDVGRPIANAELPAILGEIFRDQMANGELAIAANIALVLERRDLVEMALARIQEVLENPGYGMTGVYWVRLARKLVHWSATREIDEYWVAWACRALADCVRAQRAAAGVSDHHLVEALTILLPAMQERQARLVEEVLRERPHLPLSAPVQVEITVRDDFTVEDIERLVRDLERTVRVQISGRPEPSHPLFEVKITGSRRGSLIAEAQTIVMGFMMLRFLVQQASGLLGDIHGAAARGVDGARDLTRRATAPFSAENRNPGPSGETALPLMAVARRNLIDPNAGPTTLVEAAENAVFDNWMKSIVPTPDQRQSLAEYRFSIVLSG